MPTDLVGQRRPELLDPAQDRPRAHVDAAVGQNAGDAFGRSAELQVVPDGQQNDVTWEAMAGHQARRLAGRVAATCTANTDSAGALIVIW